MTDKFCINCIHFFCPEEERVNLRTCEIEKVPRKPEHALCKRIERPRSLVTGQHEGDPYPYCSVARETPCGESARFYEEREQEPDNSCPSCKTDTLHLTGNGNYFKCGTCGYFRKPEQEPI